MAEGKSRVLIVGGGIAGLAAAKTLKDAGISSTVFERAGDVGGRMSTKRFGGAVFDDGAQFFTVKDKRFAPLVDEWTRSHAVTDWFHSHLIKGGESNPDGHPRYCGVQGMRSLLHHLWEQDLEVRVGANVTGLEAVGDGYEITLASGDRESGDAVLLAHPAPDAVQLLGESGITLSPQDREALSEICYTPSLTVLALMDKSTALTEWGGLRIEGSWIDWIGDNERKGISPKPAVTIQAMPGFSGEHWYDDDDDVAQMLTSSVAKLLRCEPVEAKVVRWELGKPANTHPHEWAAARGHERLLLAGDGFRGYRVEGAAVSGMEAANELIRQLG